MCSSVVRSAAHLGEVVEKSVHHAAALAKVDQEVVGHRQEGLVEVGHHQHLGLRQVGLEVVEVYAAVERAEAHLDYICARVCRAGEENGDEQEEGE